MKRDPAATGKYSAVIAAALVVDGGIYRNHLVTKGREAAEAALGIVKTRKLALS